jgi:lipid II:glycine glycyltransferase (peptidoglycan interpeptide bridge formation enzyme)
MALHLSPSFISDKAQWEMFVASFPEANFLQSWNWGVFHEALGKKVFRLALHDEDRIHAGALCVKEEAKRGTYLTVAGGPLVDWENGEVVKKLFAEIAELAKKEHCVFVRIRPQAVDSPAIRKTVQELGLQPSPMHLTADLTLQLDLQKTEDELLAGMRKNTRYDVRRTEKLGITVKTSADPNDIQTFYDHQLALAHKHGFVPFSYEFLYQQFKTFVNDHQVILFHAYQGEQLLASAFVILYNHEAVYHYGISTPANDRLPGSYACQWAAIQWAKQNGGKTYNFWGIAPEDQPEHRFAGVSLFKRGFGGTEVQYLPAHDLPIHWQYGVTKAFETVRKKLRKL